MKLKHIHIDNYKLFHDFDIDFCDGNEPLRIVVIAGINGIGKSTLLEYIKPKNMSSTSFGTIQVVTEGEDKVFAVPPSMLQDKAYKEAFSSVLYFSADNAGTDSLDLEDLLGYSDSDLALIRMEIIRKQKEVRNAKNQ